VENPPVLYVVDVENVLIVVANAKPQIGRRIKRNVRKIPKEDLAQEKAVKQDERNNRL
jgi:hypothetical protein